MTRRSKRELERSLDDLDDGDALPEAGLIRILSAERAGECESVDGAPGLIRCYGDVYRLSPTFVEQYFTSTDDPAGGEDRE